MQISRMMLLANCLVRFIITEGTLIQQNVLFKAFTSSK